MEPLPSTAILVIVSSCSRFIELPFGPSSFPTKLNCKYIQSQWWWQLLITTMLTTITSYDPKSWTGNICNVEFVMMRKLSLWRGRIEADSQYLSLNFLHFCIFALLLYSYTFVFFYFEYWILNYEEIKFVARANPGRQSIFVFKFPAFLYFALCILILLYFVFSLFVFFFLRSFCFCILVFSQWWWDLFGG